MAVTAARSLPPQSGPPYELLPPPTLKNSTVQSSLSIRQVKNSSTKKFIFIMARYSKFVRSFHPNGTATRFVAELFVHDRDADEVVCLEPDVIRCQGSIAAAALKDSVCRQLGDSQCEVSIVHSHYSLDSDDEFKDACEEKYRETVFRPPKRIRRDAVYDVDTFFLGDTITIDSSNDFSSDSGSDSDAESEDGPRSSTPVSSSDGSTSPPTPFSSWIVALPGTLPVNVSQLSVSMTLSNSHFDSLVIDTSIDDSDDSTLPLIIFDCGTQSPLPPQACKERRQPPVFDLV